METKLTIKDVWNSTILFGLLGIALLGLLIWLYRNQSSIELSLQVTLASGLFWGVVAVLAFWRGWEFFYQFFYPAWVRPFAILDPIFYGLIGLGLWALAVKMPGIPVFWFVLFGAIEGLLEHILGIYGMHILDKVPWLQGLPTVPLLIFSFFEYLFYWSLTAGLALILDRLL